MRELVHQKPRDEARSEKQGRREWLSMLTRRFVSAERKRHVFGHVAVNDRDGKF